VPQLDDALAVETSRLIVHAGAFNLGLLMRRAIGRGTPRGLQGHRHARRDTRTHPDHVDPMVGRVATDEAVGHVVGVIRKAEVVEAEAGHTRHAGLGIDALPLPRVRAIHDIAGSHHLGVGVGPVSIGRARSARTS
jgi:hypothetical protein